MKASFRSVRPSSDIFKKIKVKTSVHRRSKTITHKHLQGFCYPSRPNTRRKKTKQNTNWNKCRRVGRVSRRLPDADANFTAVDDGPESQTELGGCLHPGKVTEGRWWRKRGGSSSWKPPPWPSKHQMRGRRQFIWSRAEAALRWESDSLWIYYPTNPESGALRKSSTADCCCLGLCRRRLRCAGGVFFCFFFPAKRCWTPEFTFQSNLRRRLSSPCYSAARLTVNKFRPWTVFSERTGGGRQLLPPAPPSGGCEERLWKKTTFRLGDCSNWKWWFHASWAASLFDWLLWTFFICFQITETFARLFTVNPTTRMSQK